jgi:hypothetical protein
MIDGGVEVESAADVKAEGFVLALHDRAVVPEDVQPRAVVARRPLKRWRSEGGRFERQFGKRGLSRLAIVT